MGGRGWWSLEGDKPEGATVISMDKKKIVV